MSPHAIDLSSTVYQHTHHPCASSANVQQFLGWVQSHPQRTSLRVYVRSGILNSENRKLQTRLQALGCTVIARASFR